MELIGDGALAEAAFEVAPRSDPGTNLRRADMLWSVLLHQASHNNQVKVFFFLNVLFILLKTGWEVLHMALEAPLPR